MDEGAFLRKTKHAAGSKTKHMLLLGVFIPIMIFVVLNNLIAKPIESIAVKQVSAEAAKLLNDSLKEVMDEYALAGGASFAVEQSSGGENSVLFIDAVGMNLMASRVTERAQQKVAELGLRGIDVALGSASGMPILNGSGPRIPVGVEPIGKVSGKFSSAFESAGVNQTRYRAMLNLSADIEVLLLGRTKSVSTAITAPICEAIVIGGVPSAYTNVESLDDALNLIPTDAE